MAKFPLYALSGYNKVLGIFNNTIFVVGKAMGINMYNCGLVLEGGGNRAIYSSGVLDAFIEEGIKFPYVIGVSAGSCNGVSYIGECKGRQHEITTKYCNDKRYMGISHLIKSGEFLNGDWLFGELTYQICPLDYDTYENSGTKMCVVCTNANTGKAEYFYPDGFREWGCKEIRASCSMPIVTKGVTIGGQLYFDGGLVNSVPLERAYQDGCQKAVVILTQHKGYVKEPVPKRMCKAIKKYPKIREVMENRHIMYNNQLEYVQQMESEGKAYVIQPSVPLHTTTLEKDVPKLESIYQLGYEQGHRYADEVISFLNS